MTPGQIELAKALGRCAFVPATATKRFARDMAWAAEHNPGLELSEKQDKYLRDLAYKYRKNIPVGVNVRYGGRPFEILNRTFPKLARCGLIKNEPWLQENCAAAVALYPAAGIQSAAALIAALHPRAIDYLRQAPCIAVAALGQHHQMFDEVGMHKHLLAAWAQMQRGAKLRWVMQAFNVQYPLRRLVAEQLSVADWLVVSKLSTLNPSTLAQVIPAPQYQRRWLDQLYHWTTHMERRFGGDCYFDWIVTHWPVNAAEHDLGAVADFMGRMNPSPQTVERWSFDRAAALTAEWHYSLGRAADGRILHDRCGVRWDTEVDYAPLPHIFTAGPYTFLALRSGKALHDEGRVMHHCVSDYLDEVLIGQSRIYSIRDDRLRYATVELRPVYSLNRAHPDRWAVAQVRGPLNQQPHTQVLGAVEAFMQSINQSASALSESPQPGARSKGEGGRGPLPTRRESHGQEASQSQA